MEALEYIRGARPGVEPATPQETADIKASFEGMAAEPPGRLRALLRRLTRRQIAAIIAALLIVPAGAAAVVTQVLDHDRSEQVEQATSSPRTQEMNREIARGLIEICREKGSENPTCAEVLRGIDGEEGVPEPEP